VDRVERGENSGEERRTASGDGRGQCGRLGGGRTWGKETSGSSLRGGKREKKLGLEKGPQTGRGERHGQEGKGQGRINYESSRGGEEKSRESLVQR